MKIAAYVCVLGLLPSVLAAQPRPTAAHPQGDTPAPSQPDASSGPTVAQALASLRTLARERPLRAQAAAAWTATGAIVIRTVIEVVRSTTNDKDWSQGGHIEAMLFDNARLPVASAQSSIEAGSFVGIVSLTPLPPMAVGDYDLRVVGSSVASPLLMADSLTLAVRAPPAGTGAILLRIGPTTGHRETPTADVRFRRAERLVVETPAAPTSDADEVISARLLDRTGTPLVVPVSRKIRVAVDGSRWRRVEINLAPFAPGDYIVESSAGAERTLTAFRIVQ